LVCREDHAGRPAMPLPTPMKEETDEHRKTI
jgi:hypothetical protein